MNTLLSFLSRKKKVEETNSNETQTEEKRVEDELPKEELDANPFEFFDDELLSVNEEPEAFVRSHPDSENRIALHQRIRDRLPIEKLDASQFGSSPKASANCLRFVCISDTHSKESMLLEPDWETAFGLPANTCTPASVPPGDVLLHCGDFTKRGDVEAVENFNAFLGRLPHAHKIVIAGNHELTFDPSAAPPSDRRDLHREADEVLKQKGLTNVRQLLTNCIYLEDSGVQIGGVNIWGAPWTPCAGGLAFNKWRGDDILERWHLIPSTTDVLMTHGPPLGVGDVNHRGDAWGCAELLASVRKRVRPKWHVFGHIHESHGVFSDGVTTFVNAAVLNQMLLPLQPAVVFDMVMGEGVDKEEALGKVSTFGRRGEILES